ncbi:cysteine hydrolase family protein [Gilvibacter sediminis]|uniref:cysteine hydrolase family protein n=1 Tax=Gilvibacter sediminis TaxID=379071 RepID=UPI00234FFF0A|nr:cysteine hydrolase family protein [Gilvibacter sediminis]MDC7998149.1 cysteine hydrolase family protein [Gilvibacter sediminis]
MRTLLLIDIQQGFDDIAYWGGNRNNPDAETKAGELLALFRERDWPVYHIQHCSTNSESPLRPDFKGNAIQEVVKPIGSEPVYTKTVNSAFIGTPLEEVLNANAQKQVVMAGLTTDHCVSTSVRMAANLGFEVTLIEDATATFDKTDRNGKHYDAQLLHETALASLDGEFAQIQTLDQFKSTLA